MSKNIVNDAKAEVAANKPAKQPKVIKVKSLLTFTVTVIISLAIGAYVGITINNAINNAIDCAVTAQVKQLK